MGAPGLAFETWDPSNQFPLETPTFPFVIPSETEGSAVSADLSGYVFLQPSRIEPESAGQEGKRRSYPPLTFASFTASVLPEMHATPYTPASRTPGLRSPRRH
jgi:hypothetical protein